MRSSRARCAVLGMPWLVATLVAADGANPADGASAPAAASAAAAAAPIPPALPPPPADLAAPPEQAKRLPSGLAYVVLVEGKGPDRARPQDMVAYYHVGWTADGKVFDAALQKGHPASTRVRKAIPGLKEALLDMAIGEKRRLWMPEALGYAGKEGKPKGPLVMEAELVSIRREPDPLPPPEDVAAVPKGAKKRDSGLAWRLVTKGKGKKHPAATDTVEIIYTGWKPDGNMFVTSTVRPHPDALRVDKCIPGWVEGLQLLVEGDHARFWVPEDLAYKGNAEAGPPGMVVFDVELVRIQ